jgi:hypothetical protein
MKTFIFFILSCSIAVAQPLKKLAFNSLYHASISPAGELYTLSDKGIHRFDKNGETLMFLSLPTSVQVSQLDAWHLTQLVLYYRAQHFVEIYNPEPALRTSFAIDSAFAIEPQWIAASFDQQHYWIFDQADISIKKVNRKTGEVNVDEIIAALVSEPVLSLREYQRFLFIQTSTSLLVFNNLGKHIRTFPLSKNQSFTFFGEELVIVSDATATLISLFSTEERTLPLPGQFTSIYLSDDRLFGVSKNAIEIFPFTPN